MDTKIDNIYNDIIKTKNNIYKDRIRIKTKKGYKFINDIKRIYNFETEWLEGYDRDTRLFPSRRQSQTITQEPSFNAPITSPICPIFKNFTHEIEINIPDEKAKYLNNFIIYDNKENKLLTTTSSYEWNWTNYYKINKNNQYYNRYINSWPKNHYESSIDPNIMRYIIGYYDYLQNIRIILLVNKTTLEESIEVPPTTPFLSWKRVGTTLYPTPDDLFQETMGYSLTINPFIIISKNIPSPTWVLSATSNFNSSSESALVKLDTNKYRYITNANIVKNETRISTSEIFTQYTKKLSDFTAVEYNWEYKDGGWFRDVDINATWSDINSSISMTNYMNYNISMSKFKILQSIWNPMSIIEES